MNKEIKKFVKSKKLSELKLHKENKSVELGYRSVTLERIGLIISRFQKLESTIIKLTSVLLDEPQLKGMIDIHQYNKVIQ